MSEIAPHTCCLCGSPAYVGFNEVQCTNAECRHYHLETAELFAGETSIPKPKGQTDPLEGRGWGTPAVYHGQLDVGPGFTIEPLTLTYSPVEGQELDKWAELMGLCRVEGEPDSDLRERVAQSYQRAPATIVDDYNTAYEKGYEEAVADMTIQLYRS